MEIAMADFRMVADVWVGERLKADEGKERDVKYFAAESRTNLLLSYILQ